VGVLPDQRTPFVTSQLGRGSLYVVMVILGALPVGLALPAAPLPPVSAGCPARSLSRSAAGARGAAVPSGCRVPGGFVLDG
jgi:hypothetical protein